MVDKTFAAQFINIGLVIVVINIRYQQLGALGDSINDEIKGQYIDFNSQWFFEIGTTVCMTIIANVFSMPLGILAGAVIKELLRFYDRKFTNDVSITRYS